MSIPEPIVKVLIAGAAALIAALVGVAVKAINAWADKLGAEAAAERNYLGVAQAASAVAAVEQTMSNDDEPAVRLARAVELAPLATLAQIEQQVAKLKREPDIRREL